MKIFCLLCAILLPASPGLLAKTAGLKFDRMPLGNAARVLSARFHAPVTIAARADTRVSGDFSDVGLRAALTALAAQADLDVVPLGAADAAGFLLRQREVIDPSRPPPPSSSAARRAALLQERARLEKAAADLSRSEGR